MLLDEIKPAALVSDELIAHKVQLNTEPSTSILQHSPLLLFTDIVVYRTIRLYTVLDICVHYFRAFIAAWLNASHINQDSVRLNRSDREKHLKCFCYLLKVGCYAT